MPKAPELLLLDDGELHEVAQLLESIGVPFTRRVGADVGDDLAPPLDLVIATPSRASAVRRGSPPGAGRSRPIRIVATDQASSAMRRRMKRLGFDVLVMLPAHPDLWRMLVEQAPAATPPSAVSITTGRTQQQATLLDLANRGCRLQSQREFRAGVRLDFELDLDQCGPPSAADTLRLSGKLLRVSGELDTQGLPLHSAAMLFDDDMPGETRAKLASLLNALSTGAPSFSQARVTPIPPCESPVSPGLTLDDETDPPIRANSPVELRLRHETPDPQLARATESPERRAHARGDFPGRVLAESGDGRRVLVGRDISAGGMRIEGSTGLREGARFRLAIYGPAELQPHLVNARVVRDDGAGGMALRFEDVSDELAEKLGKLVDCLPRLQSLEDSEDSQLGAVISQILTDL